MRPKLDYGKLVRMEVTERDDLKDDILRIAKNSFPDDRRFHILPECDEDIAALVLETWVREMSGALVCMYKERPVGFAELRETGGDGLLDVYKRQDIYRKQLYMMCLCCPLRIWKI